MRNFFLNSSKPREERYLAKWASSGLHDIEFLVNMVDPAIKGMISAKDLSRLADIISLCIQVLYAHRRMKFLQGSISY